MWLRFISHPRTYDAIHHRIRSYRSASPWDSQLAILNATDLELPRSIYALDLSTWLTDVLEEVTFDVVALTVSAVFTDGHTEDWPLMDHACVNILENILDDLRQSVLRPAPSSPSLPPPTPSSPVSPVFRKPAKHKKQRSLLMQLVQYIASFLRIVKNANVSR